MKYNRGRLNDSAADGCAGPLRVGGLQHGADDDVPGAGVGAGGAAPRAPRRARVAAPAAAAVSIRHVVDAARAAAVPAVGGRVR
jgi:hypothetical protein